MLARPLPVCSILLAAGSGRATNFGSSSEITSEMWTGSVRSIRKTTTRLAPFMLGLLLQLRLPIHGTQSLDPHLVTRLVKRIYFCPVPIANRADHPRLRLATVNFTRLSHTRNCCQLRSVPLSRIRYSRWHGLFVRRAASRECAAAI